MNDKIWNILHDSIALAAHRGDITIEEYEEAADYLIALER